MADASAPATEPQAPVLDEFGQQAKERLVDSIGKYNALIATFKASQGTELEVLEALRDTYTDDPAINKLTEQIEKLDKALDAAIQQKDELLKPVAAKMVADRSNDNVDALTEQIAALNKTITAGKNYLTGIYGEASVSDLPAVQRRSSGGGSGGAGGNKRVRGFEVFVDGTRAEQKDSQGVMRSNLSAAARKLEVDPKVMQQAFWDAQGTQDSKQFKDSVTFTVTVNDTAHEILAKRVADEDGGE